MNALHHHDYIVPRGAAPTHAWFAPSWPGTAQQAWLPLGHAHRVGLPTTATPSTHDCTTNARVQMQMRRKLASLHACTHVHTHTHIHSICLTRAHTHTHVRACALKQNTHAGHRPVPAAVLRHVFFLASYIGCVALMWPQTLRILAGPAPSPLLTIAERGHKVRRMSACKGVCVCVCERGHKVRRMSACKGVCVLVCERICVRTRMRQGILPAVHALASTAHCALLAHARTRSPCAHCACACMCATRRKHVWGSTAQGQGPMQQKACWRSLWTRLM